MDRVGAELRVAVIGAGGIARSQHLPQWRSHPRVRLVGLSDINQTQAHRVAEQFAIPVVESDWRRLIERTDIDVVDVTTPNAWHAPMTIASLEAGKDVLCEKPIATNSTEARAMVEAAQRTGRRLMINHEFRFSPTLEALRTLAHGELLGSVYHAHARWTRRRGVPALPTFIDKSLAVGGPVLDLGVHVLDLALWIMGFPKAERVSARVSRRLASNQHLGGTWGDWDRDRYSVEDHGIGLFHFAGGATLLLEAGWLAFQPMAEERSLKILGERSGLYWPEGIIVSERNKIPYNQQIIKDREGNLFERSIHGFIDAILEDRPTPIPPEDMVTVITMIEGFYRSAEENREVDL